MHTRSHVDGIHYGHNELLGSIALSAQAAMVLKISSGGALQEVYAKNPQDTFHPASLTKLLSIMTALDVASRFGHSPDTMLEMKRRGQGTTSMWVIAFPFRMRLPT